MKYRPEIDGLRTIAVLSVIIYHAEFSIGSGHLLKGGFLGVDIFFVISGFLITTLIINEFDNTGNFSVVNFYERRIRRLFPVLLIVMLSSLPFAWQHLLPTQLIEFSKSLITSLFFISNFFWYEVLGEYETESALIKPFLHTWSLAVEEQYYIIFPFFFVAILNWFKNRTIIILASCFVLSLFFGQWLTFKDASLSFYMLPSRLWEMVMGSLLAHIIYYYPLKSNTVRFKQYMPKVGLFLIFYSVFFTSLDSFHPGFITLIPAFGTILIIWFADKNEFITKVLSSKLLVGIGLISYSLYLWHYPVFAFSRINDFNISVYDKLEWILLTFMLSITTYFLIEKPFRSKYKTSRKVLVVSLLGAIGIVTIFSYYSINNKGLKERFPKLMEVYGKNEFDNKLLQRASWNILEDLAKSHGLTRSTAHTPSTFEMKHLWYSNDVNTKKVLLIGNSHSKDLFNALYQNKEYFPNLEFARFGMDSLILPEQIKLLFKSKNFISSDIVVISFRYYGSSLNGIPNLIESIKNGNKKVVLVSNMTGFKSIDNKPVFDWYLETLNEDFSAMKLKELFFNSRNDITDKINDSLRKIAQNRNILFLDKNDFICDIKSFTCDGITNEGYKSFYDEGHFTLEGAKYFGHRIHELKWLEIY